MGTPTMGGTVILIGMGLGYLLAGLVRSTFTVVGVLVLLVTVGLGAVGFLDDFIKVKRRRSLGLSKTGKMLGQAVVAIAFGLLAVHLGHASRDLSFIRDSGLNLGIAFYVWVLVMLASSSNGVNITDGLDGLASGSSILVLSRVRVRRVLAVSPRLRGASDRGLLCGFGRRLARPSGRGSRSGRRGIGLLVVERGAGPDLHG